MPKKPQHFLICLICPTVRRNATFVYVDRFPFDKMECKMTFSLIIQQALRVKLEPKCQWNVPIDKANQKVSVLNSL